MCTYMCMTSLRHANATGRINQVATPAGQEEWETPRLIFAPLWSLGLAGGQGDRTGGPIVSRTREGRRAKAQLGLPMERSFRAAVEMLSVEESDFVARRARTTRLHPGLGTTGPVPF